MIAWWWLWLVTSKCSHPRVDCAVILRAVLGRCCRCSCCCFLFLCNLCSASCNLTELQAVLGFLFHSGLPGISGISVCML
ncbi:hypothetical protein BS78_10G165400 [Paspalum vaginatum]|nr:hypothetical protein BS78_10G165400 [Paspalum vaginatum]